MSVTTSKVLICSPRSSFLQILSFSQIEFIYFQIVLIETRALRARTILGNLKLVAQPNTF